jgi:hypothetical protein
MSLSSTVVGATAPLDELCQFYAAVRKDSRRSPEGEPGNTGKTIEHLLARATRFATEGTILNVVSAAKTPV